VNEKAEPWTVEVFEEAIGRRCSLDKGWVVLHEVSNNRASRRADVVAVSTWGNPYLVGFEIKTSRADWLRETEDPGKREWIEKVCRFRWIVAPTGIVQPAELHHGWGLLERRGDGLRRVVAAPSNEVPVIEKWAARQFYLQALALADRDRQIGEMRGLLNEEERKAKVEGERAEILRFQMEVSEQRNKAKEEQREIEACWRALCGACGMEYRWEKRAPRIPLHEIVQKIQFESAKRLIQEAETALSACQRLVDAAKERTHV